MLVLFLCVHEKRLSLTENNQFAGFTTVAKPQDISRHFMTTKCKLCETNKSSKIKSHYVSKFLRKDIFENGISAQVKNDLSKTNINDLPKDQYIFCNECEDKFELIETISSKILQNIEEKNNFKKLYVECFENGNHLIELSRNTLEFNLFILSLIWRMSISSHLVFEKFKIPLIQENYIKQLLNSSLKNIKDEYNNNSYRNFNFKYVIIKPENRNENTRSHLSAFSSTPNIHMAFLVNFYICIYFDDSTIPFALRKYCNESSNNLKIIFGDDEKWKNLNNTALNKFMNKNVG